MDWFEFLLNISNALGPFITLIMFSIGLSYLSKKENHLFSYVSFLETFVGFLIVIVIIFLYKVNFIEPDTFYLYTFFLNVGIFWGTLGLIWGLVFWFIPIEKNLKIDSKIKRRKSKKYKYPRPEV
jgi:hypothetical protein